MAQTTLKFTLPIKHDGFVIKTLADNSAALIGQEDVIGWEGRTYTVLCGSIKTASRVLFTLDELEA